ncbi:MAG: hypothetical protein ACLQBD_11450 [Syntrophobacteraceae bacterium]
MMHIGFQISADLTGLALQFAITQSIGSKGVGKVFLGVSFNPIMSMSNPLRFVITSSGIPGCTSQMESAFIRISCGLQIVWIIIFFTETTLSPIRISAGEICLRSPLDEVVIGFVLTNDEIAMVLAAILIVMVHTRAGRQWLPQRFFSNQDVFENITR